jgi:putative phage-type endonuclease
MPITQEQLLERKKFIGSSDSAAILGICPFKSPVDVYMDKLGLVENKLNESDAIQIGNELEGAVLNWFAKKQGFKLLLNQRQVHANGIMAANFDALVDGDPTQALEAKTHAVVSNWISDEWGEVETDQVPERIAIQCQHQMAVIPTIQTVWVPVLLGGVGLRHYKVNRNPELIAHLEEVNVHFWKEYVEKHIPPEGYQASLESLKSLKRVPNKVVTVPDMIVEEWLEAKANVSAAEKIKKEKEKNLLSLFEDAEAAKCGLGDITYYEINRKGFTVEPTSYRQLSFKKQK